MDSEEFSAWRARVEQKARDLWEAQGRPAEGPEHFMDMAQELLAIAENPQATTRPVHDPRIPDAEHLIALENQGEFPGLADQGEESPHPRRPAADDDSTAPGG
jgi:hypothetical protein